MRTTVVTGLLGSGKTTFIRNFLNGRREKAVVLVNDFGQAGIDGEIISAGGIEAVELPSGCVCCTLKFDLIASIQKVVKQFSPGHLLIEPSGVASPAGVLEALESSGVALSAVVGIVDAVEFAGLYGSGMYGNFFREQIEHADTLLLNKADIATEDQIATAERTIAGINPRAVLFRTVNAVLDLPLPLTKREQSTPPLPIGERTGARGDIDAVHPLPLGQGAGVRGALSWQRSHCQFETLSFKIRQAAPLSVLRVLFDDLAAGTYGAIARAKALIATDQGPYRFDLTFGKIDVARFPKNVADSRLVVIGEKLDGEGIGSLVLRL